MLVEAAEAAVDVEGVEVGEAGAGGVVVGGGAGVADESSFDFGVVEGVAVGFCEL